MDKKVKDLVIRGIFIMVILFGDLVIQLTTKNKQLASCWLICWIVLYLFSKGFQLMDIFDRQLKHSP